MVFSVEANLVRVMGEMVGGQFMEVKLQNFWPKEGDIIVVYHPTDKYVVHFASEKYYNYDLLEVP